MHCQPRHKAADSLSETISSVRAVLSKFPLPPSQGSRRRRRRRHSLKQYPRKVSSSRRGRRLGEAVRFRRREPLKFARRGFADWPDVAAPFADLEKGAVFWMLSTRRIHMMACRNFRCLSGLHFNVLFRKVFGKFLIALWEKEKSPFFEVKFSICFVKLCNGKCSEFIYMEIYFYISIYLNVILHILGISPALPHPSPVFLRKQESDGTNDLLKLQ